MKPLKVLVADDDSAVCSLLKKLLTSWGHEVEQTLDGSEALELLRDSGEFQVVVLDWNMPGLRGDEICRRLRAEQNDIYILMLTGLSEEADVLAGLGAGANDYLTKPFLPEALRLRLLVASRFVEMQSLLTQRVVELEGGILERRQVDELLTGMMNSEAGVSDLLFVAGKQPQVEVFGKLKPAGVPGWDHLLTPEETKRLAGFLMDGNERLRGDYDKLGSCDCSYEVKGVARLRVNIYKQNGASAIVMRKLQSEIPSIGSLNLPMVFREMIKEKNGIIFVTGGTGSGKTTTLAAMLNELNQTADIHVVTLEDPIEFLHPQLRATFSQRQLGQDFIDFSGGLRAALRQAPKVILVGEIRDRETMEIAMTASETGHLVFSTLHTINAGQTISRIVGMFGKDEEAQVRQRLAETLRYVISQRLISKIGGGRVMVTEIMGTGLRTRETICQGESEGRSFHEIMEATASKGWHSFDQSLLKAYAEGLITEETVMLYCNSKSTTSQKLDKVKQIRGVQELEASGLRLKLAK